MAPLSSILKNFQKPSFCPINSSFRSFSTHLATKNVKITDITLCNDEYTFPYHLPFKSKIELINQLAEKAHVTSVQIGSLVERTIVPIRSDIPHVIEKTICKENHQHWVVVNNQRGLEIALKKGARDFSIPISLSETFIKKNAYYSVTQSFKNLAAMMQTGQSIEGVRFRVYISCCLPLSENEEMPIDHITDLTHHLSLLQCNEIFFSRLTEKNTSIQIRKLLLSIQQRGITMECLGLRLYGTGAQVLDHVQEGLSSGIRLFDASMGDLRGSIIEQDKNPILTEELVPFIHELGYETGIKLLPLLALKQKIINDLV